MERRPRSGRCIETAPESLAQSLGIAKLDDVSNLIQTARVEQGVTNAELARRLQVTPGAVSQLERSERDGSIRWESLERALAALGRRPRLEMHALTSTPDYGAEAITASINRALDDGDEAFALRILTRAAHVVRESTPEQAADRRRRASKVKDARWETLFGALYGDALPIERKPAWARPQPLARPWYVSRFSALRERAKTATPERLRQLNILIDERSLSRA